MADITSDIQKMTTDDVGFNKPNSESLFIKIGATLNGLIDRWAERSSQVFLANGTYTVPDGVNRVLLFGCGGGGGGAGGTGVGGAGSGGGAGAVPYLTTVAVTPGAQLAVTIGAGGAGGAGNNDGGDGGDTKFGNLATFAGAPGGSRGSGANAGKGGHKETTPRQYTSGGDQELKGGDSIYALGGSGGATSFGNIGGGGGGAGYGPGGDGGSAVGGVGLNGESASSNSGAGGGGAVTGLTNTGGSGGSGFLVVIPFS